MSQRRVSAKIGSITRFNKKYKPSLKNEYAMIKNRKAVNIKSQYGRDEAQSLQYDGDDPSSEDDQQDINQLATMKYQNEITSLSMIRGKRGSQKNNNINEADQIDISHKIRLNRQLNIVIWSLSVIISVLLFSHYQFRLLSQSQLLVVHESSAKASYAPGQPHLQQNFGKQFQSTTSKKETNEQEYASKQPKTMQEQFMDSYKKEDEKEDVKQDKKVYEKADIREIKQEFINKKNMAEVSALMKNQIKGSLSLTATQFSIQPKKQEASPKKYRMPAPPPNQKYSKSLDLKDFSNDFVYQQAPEDMKQIFTEMIRRPADKRSRPNSIFMPSQKAYFAYRLFKNPDNPLYEKAQFYYYDQKYRISQYVEQMQLCVVAPGRNITANEKYKRFIDSIQRQNYTHYRLVYIDDLSDDNAAEKLQQYVKSTKGFLTKIDESNEIYEGSFIIDKQTYRLEEDPRRLIIVKNTERVYALANRNQGIRQYCPENSIVLDVDADDAIIGKQAFKLINAVYHDPEVWMFNSVFIYDKSIQRQVTTGPQQGVPQQLLQNNQYRTGMTWRTSELRTFKTKLFNKINENDFKDENGVFYKWASDVFVQMPLVELAGPKHYKHLYQILYYYDWDFNRTTIYKRRHYRDIAFMQTPYKPLQSLDDDAVKLQNYVVPDRIRVEYERNIKQAKAEGQRYGRSEAF